MKKEKLLNDLYLDISKSINNSNLFDIIYNFKFNFDKTNFICPEDIVNIYKKVIDENFKKLKDDYK